ncbi:MULTISPECIES: type II toxin-antitoxin system HicA family toxin [Persicobacter]|uniref:Type II toxin-antitoxin system HicA family toxin n=1 Tax=Persicobacter diffluens TaxID=981 RepID=A0AAN4VUK6_9BACT|nr:type II toxin-antitoxin system HicA family toxin [Persicobacter sp. CCB-QB2]GJM60261.1 hypothetical protein PEDI_08130 [Persicobacter diffluens]
MSKIEKLIEKLNASPKDFTYDELTKVLNHLGYEEYKKGKTAGSRRAFVNPDSGHIIRLHKPHPLNILKPYQVRDVVKSLREKYLI